MDEYGPNAGWQCYTREANDAMEAMFNKLAADLNNGSVTRLTLPVAINAYLDAVARHLSEPGGIRDTEPEWALVDRLNPVLDELGYKSISREDF